MTHVLSLPPGTDLVGDYRIERVLGAGGFGITYLAEETALARVITIKEYFPSDFAARSEAREAVPRSQECASDYKWGLERFIEEAQTLARFDHRHIVRVYRYFRANNTGYMVLQFEEGGSLKSWLKALGRAPRQHELDAIVTPLLDALELIHKADFLHRDIAPDNIIIRKDGSPVLIDFGSARGDIAQVSRTVSALVKPGYSPYEQYAETGKQQGPWTDIYAFAATLYHAVTGKRPPDAPSRVVKDELIPAREAAVGAYRPGFLAAIDRGLALEIDRRPSSVAAWRGDLLAPEPTKPGWVRRTLGRRPPEQAMDVDGPARELTVEPAAIVPPPPDAPGRKGGLLDYIDGLKKQPHAPLLRLGSLAKKDAEPAPPVNPGAATSPKAAPPAPLLPNPAVKEPRPAPALPPPAAVRARPARPKPFRLPAASLEWRPLAVKLMIGAAIAAGAVFVQQNLPRLDVRGAGVASSQTGEVHVQGQLRAHAGGVQSALYADDGASIVTTGADATLKVWDTLRGTLIRTIELENGAATALALMGSRAVTGHADGTLVLWDVEKADKLATFKRNEASIWSVTFAGEPGRFAASSHDWSVAVWNAATPSSPSQVFDGHENVVQAVAYSARGDYLAAGSADRTVKLWSLATGSLIRTYRGQRDFISAIAFSPDGKLLAVATMDGAVRIWSATGYRLYRVLSGHRGRINAIAFAPDGDALASAGEDGTARLWDFRRGRQVKLLAGHGGPVRSIDFSPTGRRVATGSADGTVRIWDAAMPRPARERVGTVSLPTGATP